MSYSKKPQSKQHSTHLRMSSVGSKLAPLAKKAGMPKCDIDSLRHPLFDSKIRAILDNAKMPFWQNYRTDYGTRHFISKQVFSYMGKPVRMAVWLHKSQPSKPEHTCGDWRLDDFYDVSFEFQWSENSIHPEADGTSSFNHGTVMKKERVQTKEEAYALVEKYMNEANLDDIKLVKADKANMYNWRIVDDHCANFGLPRPTIPKEWHDNWMQAFHGQPFWYPWQGTPNYRDPWEIEFTPEERTKQAELVKEVVAQLKKEGKW